MESLNIDELEIDEERYQAWKAELVKKRESRSSSAAPEQTIKPHSPRSPQHFFDEAAKQRAEARAAIHVETRSTNEIFKHIDELLEAS